MTIEFKTPSALETEMMQNFAALVGQGIEMLAKHELGEYAGLISHKLHEAMLWHSHAVLNKKPVESPVVPLEGDVIEANATVQ
jgi:hypothetical protein